MMEFLYGMIAFFIVGLIMMAFGVISDLLDSLIKPIVKTKKTKKIKATNNAEWDDDLGNRCNDWENAGNHSYVMQAKSMDPTRFPEIPI